MSNRPQVQPGANRRLDSWKEIAAFFGRDERTVRRWEKERALPAHRVPGGPRSGVFAYTAELSEWLKQPSGAEEEPISPPVAPSIAAAGSRFQAWRIVGIVLLVIFLGAIILKHQVPTADARKPAAVHRPNPEAEDLYLKGRYFWNKRTPEDLNKALDLFTQAIVRDPSYSQAYVGLADCYNLLREYSVMPASEAYPRALAAAKKAVELDDTSAEAHNSLAFVTFYWEWDAATAEREFKRAIALNPDYVAAHHWYATFLLAQRRYPEAVREIETARKLDPSSTPIMADKGYILYGGGQFDESMVLLKQIESADPTFLSSHLYLSDIYFLRKDYPNYFAESEKVALLRHDQEAMTILKAGEKGFASGGARGMWEDMLPVQKRFYGQGLLPPYRLAQTYSALGDKEDALKYLREAYGQRDSAVVFMNSDPSFDGLRDSPSFHDLLARAGQPQPEGLPR